MTWLAQNVVVHDCFGGQSSKTCPQHGMTFLLFVPFIFQFINLFSDYFSFIPPFLAFIFFTSLLFLLFIPFICHLFQLSFVLPHSFFASLPCHTFYCVYFSFFYYFYFSFISSILSFPSTLLFLIAK